MKMLGIDISLTGFESAAAVMRANKIQSKAKVNRGRAPLEQLFTLGRKYRGPKSDHSASEFLEKERSFASEDNKY